MSKYVDDSLVVLKELQALFPPLRDLQDKYKDFDFETLPDPVYSYLFQGKNLSKLRQDAVDMFEHSDNDDFALLRLARLKKLVTHIKAEYRNVETWLANETYQPQVNELDQLLHETFPMPGSIAVE